LRIINCYFVNVKKNISVLLKTISITAVFRYNINKTTTFSLRRVDEMTTGETIAIIRESRDILQKDLAKAINLDPVVLNRIEKNKRPARGDELKAIADYFDISTDYLLGRKNTKRTISLSSEQKKLLKGFDELPDESKQTILSLISQLNFGRNSETAPKETSDYIVVTGKPVITVSP